MLDWGLRAWDTGFGDLNFEAFGVGIYRVRFEGRERVVGKVWFLRFLEALNLFKLVADARDASEKVVECLDIR